MNGMQAIESMSKKTPVQPPSAEALMAENATLREQVQSLQTQLNWLKNQLFGQKSEKRLAVENPHQGSLFDSPSTPVPEDQPTEQISYTRRTTKRRGDDCVTDQGLRFDDSVPVEVIEVPAPELDGPEAEQYEIIDHKVTRRLAQRPGSYVVLEYRRPVLKHRPSQSLVTGAAPTGVFDGSLADVSLLAGILVDKFCYHLPLYRQHQRLKDAGITLSRSTLTYWAQQAIALLEPIADAQWQNILRSRVLAMDETPIKAGRIQKGKLRQGWLWPLYGQAQEISFTYTDSRAAKHIQEILGDFEGVLLSDGYAAYDAYAKDKPQITQAQCWAHTRRYFVKAEKIEPQAVAEALEQIGQLYRVEREIREQPLDREKTLEYRTKQAKPAADAFFAWCWEQRQRTDLVNSNPLARALVYVDNHREQLQVYLGDPEVPIDTNHLERGLRPIPMGRMNWLFSWTELGARQVAIIQSLLVTCRLQGVNPHAYLVDVLQRVGLHPAKDVEALTPRLWKERFADHPMTSDLAGLGQ
jgi:transposase